MGDDKMKLWIASEYDRLRTVVMATPRHFRVVDPINSIQERYFASAPPPLSTLVAEQQAFVGLLEGAGVDVRWAPERAECPFQVNTRDVGVVVGGRYVQGRMRRDIRAAEPIAVLPLVEGFAGEHRALSHGHLEGGDVLVDEQDVYVGVGERTDHEGARELSALVGPDHDVHVLELAPRILHLDVVLNLLPGDLALVYRPGLREIPRRLTDTRDLIEVTPDEQERLATNVFCIDPRTVVADERNERVASLLAGRGLDVHVLPFAETTKIGGSFRCMTLPLVRDGH
ncbi:MAG: hypothetical protein IT305_21740 [Chloroflexi bacterium]|nr:hypothetical protein [Chloroflexota bacterium]